MNKGFRKRLLIFCLVIVHILPVWLFTYFPSQDGPCHLYNAYVLTALNQEQTPLLGELYQLNTKFFPNWLTHLVLAALMFVVSPLIAEKILLSMIVALVPLSLFYFINSINRGRDSYGFLGFLFSYNYLLHMGFWNFCLSVSLYFFTLGFFWRHKEQIRIGPIVSINLLCMLIYFCHIISFALLLLSISLLAVTLYYRNPLHVAKLLGCILPWYGVMANYLLSSTAEQSRAYGGKQWLLDFFLNIKSLVYYTDAHQFITRIVFGLLTILFIATIYIRVRKKTLFNHTFPFMLLCAVLTVIFFLAPWKIGTGAVINDRIHLFIFPVLLPFLHESNSRFIRRGLIAIMILLSLAHVGISCRYYYYLNRGLHEFTSARHLVEPNTTLLVLGTDWWNYEVQVDYVEPFVQAANYYCLNNGCVNLGNYEAKFKYFPINWKQKYSGPIHYIITWRLHEDYIMTSDDIDQTHGYDLKQLKKSLDSDYDQIFSSGRNLKLYRHKSMARKITSIEQGVLRKTGYWFLDTG